MTSQIPRESLFFVSSSQNKADGLYVQKLDWSSHLSMSTKPLATGESRWNDNGINVHAAAPEDGYYTLQLWTTPHFYAWYRINGQIRNFPHGQAVYLPKGTWMKYRDTEVYYHPKISKYRVFYSTDMNDFLDSLP